MAGVVAIEDDNPSRKLLQARLKTLGYKNIRFLGLEEAMEVWPLSPAYSP